MAEKKKEKKSTKSKELKEISEVKEIQEVEDKPVKIKKPCIYVKKNYGRVQLPTGGGLNLWSGQPITDKSLLRTLVSVGILFEDDPLKCE